MSLSSAVPLSAPDRRLRILERVADRHSIPLSQLPVCQAEVRHGHWPVIPQGRYLRPKEGLAVVTASLPIAWNDEESEIQRAAVERSAKVMVLADGSKIGASSSAIVAPRDSMSILVTDSSASGVELELLRAAGVETVLADLGVLSAT